MPARDQALAIAVSEIGFRPGATGSTPFGRWYGEHAHDPSFARQPWCAMFISWCFHEAGTPLPEMQHEGYSGAASAHLMLDYCRSHGWEIQVSEAQPGDVVFFDWGSGKVSHVGFVAQPLPLQTIEGNTGKPAGVYREHRIWNQVAAVVRIPDQALGPTDRGCHGPCWACNACPA